jgi:predicted small metal-binding protein
MASIESIHLFEDQSQWLTDKDKKLFSEKVRSNLACKNYGFDCNFITKGDEVEKIIEEFREHTLQEHFIDYPEGIVMKLYKRKMRKI